MEKEGLFRNMLEKPQSCSRLVQLGVGKTSSSHSYTCHSNIFYDIDNNEQTRGLSRSGIWRFSLKMRYGKQNLVYRPLSSIINTKTLST